MAAWITDEKVIIGVTGNVADDDEMLLRCLQVNLQTTRC